MENFGEHIIMWQFGKFYTFINYCTAADARHCHSSMPVTPNWRYFTLIIINPSVQMSNGLPKCFCLL